MGNGAGVTAAPPRIAPYEVPSWLRCPCQGCLRTCGPCTVSPHPWDRFPPLLRFSFLPEHLRAANDSGCDPLPPLLSVPPGRGSRTQLWVSPFPAEAPRGTEALGIRVLLTHACDHLPRVTPGGHALGPPPPEPRWAPRALGTCAEAAPGLAGQPGCTGPEVGWSERSTSAQLHSRFRRPRLWVSHPCFQREACPETSRAQTEPRFSFLRGEGLCERASLFRRERRMRSAVGDSADACRARNTCTTAYHVTGRCGE